MDGCPIGETSDDTALAKSPKVHAPSPPPSFSSDATSGLPPIHFLVCANLPRRLHPSISHLKEAGKFFLEEMSQFLCPPFIICTFYVSPLLLQRKKGVDGTATTFCFIAGERVLEAILALIRGNE